MAEEVVEATTAATKQFRERLSLVFRSATYFDHFMTKRDTQLICFQH